MATVFVNPDGTLLRIDADLDGMMLPRLCDCGQAFDLTKVDVKARYADATVFVKPCCGREDDDRPWVSRYRRLPEEVYGR